MMKKKMYNKPVVEYAEALLPKMGICVAGSTIIGGDTDKEIIGQ